MRIHVKSLKKYYLDFFGMGLISISYFLPLISFYYLGQNFFVYVQETYLKYLPFLILTIYPFLKIKKNFLFQKLFCIIVILFIIFASPKLSYYNNRFGVIPGTYCGGIMMTEIGGYFMWIGVFLIFISSFKKS